MVLELKRHSMWLGYGTGTDSGLGCGMVSQLHGSAKSLPQTVPALAKKKTGRKPSIFFFFLRHFFFASAGRVWGPRLGSAILRTVAAN